MHFEIPTGYSNLIKEARFMLLQIQNKIFQWARARVYLHEATVRMMAGAAPVKTQQLLDKSLIQRNSARGLICIKGKFFYL